MLYLLDANVLIAANRDYYPIERVPEFWEWLSDLGQSGLAKIPQEIFEEIILPPPDPRRPDILVDWLKLHKDSLVLGEMVATTLITTVVEEGYAPDLTEEEITKVGRDPFLIAYALADHSLRCIVTTEHSKPSRVRANRHIPDVCSDFHVSCIDTFELIRRLNFRTGRRTRQ